MLVRRLASAADAPVRYAAGMVSDTNDDGASYDVIYDESDLKNDPNGDTEDDEENGVEAGRVVSMSLSPLVSCAARLNLARCCFRAARHAEVSPACQNPCPGLSQAVNYDANYGGIEGCFYAEYLHSSEGRS